MTINRKYIPHIYLIAGEESGDRLGAPLMQALKRLTGGNIAFSGIGGEKMTGQGLNSLFSMDDLSVMGLAEVLPHTPIDQTSQPCRS